MALDDIVIHESQPFLESEYGRKQRRSKLRRCQVVVASLATILLLTTLVVSLVLVAKAKPNSDRSAQLLGYKNAAVAADSAECSKVGAEILQKGGNAVDSAISTLLCLGLTDPQSMGIGGGFFMTIYNRTTGQATIIDARETAPGKATKDMFHEDPSSSSVGPLSIAVPSSVKGHWSAHQKYGHLPWSDLFQPAINMASEGFPVPIGLSDAIVDSQDVLSTEPSLKVVFINNATGQLFKEGEIMKRPQLAQTMRVIAQEGMSAFYNGSLTDQIMEDLSDIGSIITREDLNNYTVLEKAPVEITLSGGMRVISPPLPSGGVVLSFILNILDGYNFTSKDIANSDATTLTYHRIVEAFKFAYAKRTDLGDDDFIDVADLVHNLTSREYADSIRKLITDDATHNYMYYGPTYYSRYTTGTSHLSVLDQEGNAVSVTSTVNARFGSQRRGMRSGIIFNDEMDDFSSPNITNEWGLAPTAANFIAPGKRPLSSMCPAVLVASDGSVKKVLGAAGGSKITTATAWIAVHNLWLGENIKTSIDHLRLHHQLLPPQIQYETGFDQTVIRKLQNIGHNVSEVSLGKSIAQGISVQGQLIHPVSDFRKGGAPAGF